MHPPKIWDTTSRPKDDAGAGSCLLAGYDGWLLLREPRLNYHNFASPSILLYPLYCMVAEMRSLPASPNYSVRDRPMKSFVPCSCLSLLNRASVTDCLLRHIPKLTGYPASIVTQELCFLYRVFCMQGQAVVSIHIKDTSCWNLPFKDCNNDG